MMNRKNIGSTTQHYTLFAEQNKIITLLQEVEVKGSFLNVKVLNDEISSAPPTMLLISNIPPNCELDHLELHLEKSLKMDLEDHFTLTPHLTNSSALVTFKKCLTSQGTSCTCYSVCF